VSCVYGDCEWGANAEIELQDCDCFNRSARTHRRTRIVDRAIEKLAEKVAARHAELEAEIERLSQYGKSAKKSQVAAPAAKPKKRDEKKNDLAKNDLAKNDETSHEATEPVADAA
jgi:hypothetical protein